MPLKKYIEKEKEYSARNDIISLAEWKRFNSHHKINELQQGLIPVWLKFTWRFPRIDRNSKLYEDYCYFKDGIDVVSRDLNTIIVHIMGVGNNLFKVTDRFVSGNMADLYKKNKIMPFLIFIDSVFLPWSQYDLVKSDDKYTILIHNRDRDFPFNNIEILSIPFEIMYSEHDETSEYARLFSFNKNGRFDLDGPIHISSLNQNIGCAHFLLDKYNLTDLGINTDRDIQLSNIYIFSQNGMVLHTNPVTDYTYIGNLLTMDEGYSHTKKWVITLYSTESNNNEAVAMRAKNRDFLKLLIKREAIVEDLDYDLIREPYDCVLNNPNDDARYDDCIDYTFWKDHNKLDKVFESRNNMNMRKYTNLVMDGGKAIIPRDYYDEYPFKTFGIVFTDGLANHIINNSLEYTNNCIKFTPNGTMRDVWGVFFHHIINGKYDVKYDTDGIEYKHTLIPMEDVVVLTHYDDPDNLYPIEYTKVGDKLVIDPIFKDSELYVCSRQQFVHKQYVINDNVLELGKEFETCYNHKKYMVFHEGKYINPRNYKVIRPNLLNKNKVRKSAIYFKFETGVDRIIDVYYVSSIGPEPINFNGDLLIDCHKVKAKKGQRRFKVPYPFKDYPREYDSFFCIKNSLYVDKNRYIFDGRYIEFNGGDEADTFHQNDDLVFVFPYYKKDYWDGDIPISAMINFDYHMMITTTDDTTATFASYTDPVPGEAVMLFNNTTFMPPGNYSINGNVVTFGETIPANTQLTLVVERHKHPIDKLNDVVIQVEKHQVTDNPQYTFPLIYEYYDSFLMMYNSSIVPPDAYEIDYYTNTIEFTEESGGIPNDREMFIFYFKDRNDLDSTKKNRFHVQTEFITVDIPTKTQSFNIPYQYTHPYLYEHDKMVLFIDSVYYDPSRYSVVNNVVTLTDPNDWFEGGNVASIMIAYKLVNYNKPPKNLGYKDAIWFQDISVDVRLYQKRYIVPLPFKSGNDSPFIVHLDSTFIPSEWYTYDENTGIIEFKDDALNFLDGMRLNFTFVHNKGYSHFYKTEVAVDMYDGQTEVDIPAPYSNFVNFNRRMLIFLNTTYLDKERYVVDNVNRKIYLKEPILGDNFQLNFVFFYTDNRWNGLATYLPRSGYFLIKRDVIDRNINNEMMLVFINGRLIEKEHIINISNNLFKVGINPDDRRYDLSIIITSPKIADLAYKYGNMDDWTKLIDPIPITQ